MLAKRVRSTKLRFSQTLKKNVPSLHSNPLNELFHITTGFALLKNPSFLAYYFLFPEISIVTVCLLPIHRFTYLSSWNLPNYASGRVLLPQNTKLQSTHNLIFKSPNGKTYSTDLKVIPFLPKINLRSIPQIKQRENAVPSAPFIDWAVVLMDLERCK